MKIFCLFSVDNKYDQPNNNLVAGWQKKPSLEALGHALDIPFPNDSDNLTISVVNIWKGEAIRIHSTDYRLEEFTLNDTK